MDISTKISTQIFSTITILSLYNYCSIFCDEIKRALTDSKKQPGCQREGKDSTEFEQFNNIF